MKFCIHPGCSNKQYQKDEASQSKLKLCKFHENEFLGKSEWSCSWCEAQHEQAKNLKEAEPSEEAWDELDKDLRKEVSQEV